MAITKRTFTTAMKALGIDPTLVDITRQYSGAYSVEAVCSSDPLSIRRANKAVSRLMEAVCLDKWWGFHCGGYGGPLFARTGIKSEGQKLAEQNID